MTYLDNREIFSRDLFDRENIDRENIDRESIDREIFEAYPVSTDQIDRLNQTKPNLAQPELAWFDQELEGFFGSVFDSIQNTLSRSKEFLAIRQAILAGNRDANSLTNMIFFARHPERQGRRIEKTEPNFAQLRDEWLGIRDQQVLPALQSLPGVSGGSSGSSGSSGSGNAPGGSTVSSFRQRLKQIAEQEWEFFGRGSKKETQEGFYQRVGQYWQEGVNLNLDGRSVNKKGNRIPWSAAFISWLMKKAGAGDRFKRSASHSVYIRDAIQKRKTNDNRAGFKGYRLNEVTPQVGDLVCASRGEDAGKVGYDTTRSYESHCDIVVATKPGKIEVIGGNVSDSVSKKTLKTDAQGHLIDTSSPWFVVIKNLL
ncbi:MAG: DUF2272 domain-containing protein [Elainella sp. Prado103]|jgi:hypothetical protein|nr:DUF2272 domain-containing protein [Elainella sp. Prado103]